MAKHFIGTAKLKDTSTFIYDKKTYPVIGIYGDFKHGREYILDIKDNGFNEYGTTVVNEKHLENIQGELKIVPPYSEEEYLELSNQKAIEFNKWLLANFKQSIYLGKFQGKKGRSQIFYTYEELINIFTNI